MVVDDYIPLRRTHNGSLEFLFTHSMDEGEVWPCLLEKAYAKLEGKYFNNIYLLKCIYTHTQLDQTLGSYSHLSGGISTSAMVDFTGNFPEVTKVC